MADIQRNPEPVLAKEYAYGNSVLIIENIFSRDKSKADTVMELLEAEAWTEPLNAFSSGSTPEEKL